MLKQNRPSAKVRGRSSDRKIQLAECVVARERDLGVNDRQLTCITHLGNILKEGDLVLGYEELLYYFYKYLTIMLYAGMI